MRGVVAIDIERRIGFSIAEALGVGEDRVEGGSFTRHAGEDVIAGAVYDAVDALETIADEGFAQGFDDRNATGDAGFLVEISTGLFGGSEEFGAVGGEKGFVRGDDSFAAFEGGENDDLGDTGAADEFGDDLNLGIFDDIFPIESHQGWRGRVGAGLVEGFDCDLADDETDAGSRGHELRILLEGVEYAAAHGTAADHSEIDLFHRGENGSKNSWRRRDNACLLKFRVRLGWSWTAETITPALRWLWRSYLLAKLRRRDTAPTFKCCRERVHGREAHAMGNFLDLTWRRAQQHAGAMHP